MASPQITVVGSCNVDMFTYSKRIPQPGETILGTDFQKCFGGKGANQAVTTARLGGHVLMVGKVGEDSFGDETFKNFEDSRVDTKFLFRTSAKPTGIATILVDSTGTNIIVVYSGANFEVTVEDIQNARQSIEQSKVLVTQLEVPIPATAEAMRIAKSKGVFVIFNTAPAQKDLPDELYKLCDIICPNETESEILTGIPVKTIDDAEKAAKILLSRGAPQVVITLGSNGSLWVTKDKSVHIPPVKVENVKDTTGAGDCFVGSLAYFIGIGKDLETALRRASQIAAVSVQSYGTQPSFPWKKDLPSSLFE